MVSAIDLAKRALVTLLKTLAPAYGVTISVTQESSDKEVRAACRKVSGETHPDRGGNTGNQQSLNAAQEAWEDALQNSKGRGGPRKKEASAGVTAEKGQPGFRFQALGVLLTFHKCQNDEDV